MGIINVLDVEVSNKIAAGEVVERPASVVKELVENSIDAGAHVITVEIKNGGNTYIRVSDDGSGMSAEDAAIAFMRHATSKIHTEKDLDAIYTLGFRGEALSSIGSVAEVDLFTKRSEDEEGAHVVCRGGEIMSSSSAGTPDGTTFVIKNLFYNTPARMKFLKKDATEAGYISDILSRFILAHPEISFKLLNNGKEQLFSSGDSQLMNAVYAVYGKDYAKAALPVNYRHEHVYVTGVVGNGSVSRPNRNYQSFFVNRRYIKSPLIIRAVEEAYKNQIMIGKFPMAVLNIEIDPSLIDINVHPTKLEVKFSNEKMIYEAVYFGVKNALYQTVNIPKIEKKESVPAVRTAADALAVPARKPPMQTAYPKTDLSFVRDDRKKAHQAENVEKPEENTAQTEVKNQFSAELKKEDYDQSYFEEIKYAAAQEKNALPVSKISEQAIPMAEKSDIPVQYRVAGQIFSTYILVERGDEMLIIDQHAAHERLKYEQLKKRLDENGVQSQGILVPAVVNMSATEYSVYTEHAAVFQDMGFAAEDFGENCVIVRAVPQGTENADVAQVVLEMLTQLEQSKSEIITQTQERLLYTIACKSAVKANHDLSMQEMEALVRDVFALENINTCPHGRPIIVAMTKKEVEKEFKRIV